MIALSLKDIAKSFGSDTVLKGVSLTLTDEMRMGLVGPNGAGKTTLLRIICGEISADSGTVSMGDGAGYLKQEVSEGTQDTVWDTMLGVFSHAFALEERMRELEHAMEDAAGDETAWQRVSREYERVTQAFEEADGYGYKSAINGVLKGLGLAEDVYDRAVCTLSGGQRARLMLAKLLLEKPKLLLLDEPTNHLDTDAVTWLEGYLKTWQGAVMIVSHDRWFIDQTCTHIADLHNGIVDVYIGNYSSFVAQRDEKRRLQQKAYEQNQREIARQKKVIEQYKAWGNSGGGKNFIKMHARETLLNKMEKVDRPEGDHGRISLRLGTAARGSSDVLQMEHVEMAWQDTPPLFSGIGLHLYKGDRAALVGPNGVGKTTLLRIAAQRLAPTQGNIATGTGVSVGYYDQLQENLDTRNTVMEEMRGDYPALSDGELRNILASFLFLGDDVFKPVSALSGGEKGRLSLLKLMLGQDNLLLLDEPTNHLDMDSREMLEDALCQFEGTVLFVSHDRYFINKTATRVLELKDGALNSYQGNWSDYISALEKVNIPEASEEPGTTKTAAAKQKRTEKEKEASVREAKKRIAQIESDIEAAEQRLAEIETCLADPSALDTQQISELSNEYTQQREAVEALLERWEYAHSQVFLP